MAQGRCSKVAAGQPEEGKARRHQAEAVHQPSKDQAVPDAGEDARPDPERPLIDREDALPERGVGPRAGDIVAFVVQHRSVEEEPRSSERGNGERNHGRERAAERSGDFNDAPPF